MNPSVAISRLFLLYISGSLSKKAAAEISSAHPKRMWVQTLGKTGKSVKQVLQSAKYGGCRIGIKIAIFA
jgi:hypothetical protein